MVFGLMDRAQFQGFCRRGGLLFVRGPFRIEDRARFRADPLCCLFSISAESIEQSV
jgi:hypothetical protein